MVENSHGIELFGTLFVSRHTAFNFTKQKNIVSRREKLLPAQQACSEPLNVLLRNRIGVPRCRAPPDQEFSRETGQKS